MTKDLTKSSAHFLHSPTTRALGALIVVIVLGLIFNADGAFLKWGTHRDMLRAVSVYGILACGMTIVIIAGGIDLSVGSVLALTAVLFSLISIHWQWGAALAIVLCLIAGACCGALSGFFIGKFKVQAFIATLAMMVFARGVAKWLSGGQKVSTAVQQPDGSYEYGEIPEIFNFINAKILGGNIAVVTVILLGCILISWILLKKLRQGRYIYAIGGNEEAARLSGVPVKSMKILAFGMSGLFSAAAGICQASQEFQGDPEAGISYELSAIAMVVIGGTTLQGGRGSIWLTLIGILTIGYLEKILSINAVGEDKRLMLTGIIIIAAVLLQKNK
ncbi:Ribose transport system permease protein RbsC [Sedimentisphaera cyanobacteriorum]|uniref:Ribose transport system permease protein RbsC n=1 Tax=Sedimentisphaera cyanobacteriorum TaxID=1940790 RepID=A0A1Q2HRI6_9BACT|nr:ABC transporter permease [Sedimentisphaera cyanobacteriorum]AQQ09951.1 Ribose transport system permease protein RbsC [Sedimentisphaera cyanobacteriorum]